MPKSRLRVLVVDDYDATADVFAWLLRQSGYNVRCVHDGDEAVIAASQFQPEVVFLDLMMPKTDGYSAATQLRNNGCSAVLVAYTGFTDRRSIQRCRDAGFDHFLQKPAGLDQFKSILSHASRAASRITV